MVKSPRSRLGALVAARYAGNSPVPSDAELDAKVRAQADKSVLKSTVAKYKGKIWTMKDWLSKRPGAEKKTVMSAPDMARFLVSYRGGITSARTAGVWRAAWKFWKEAEGDGTATLSRTIKGIGYQAGEAPDTSPDAIDSGRLWRMAKFLMERGEKTYATGFVAIFYGMFRKKVGSELKVKDFRPDTDVGTLMFSKRMKGASATNMKPGMINNFKEVTNMTKLFKELVKNKAPDDSLFPNWNDAKANTLIKQMAVLHGWGEGKWVVTSLRHGASREAQAVLEDEPTMEALEAKKTDRKLTKRFGHCSEKSKKTYQLSHTRKK